MTRYSKCSQSSKGELLQIRWITRDKCMNVCSRTCPSFALRMEMVSQIPS